MHDIGLVDVPHGQGLLLADEVVNDCHEVLFVFGLCSRAVDLPEKAALLVGFELVMTDDLVCFGKHLFYFLERE